MSIVVDLEELARTLAEYPVGYLLTADGDGRVKAVTVEPELLDDGELLLQESRGSARNLAANPSATLLCPPTQPHGYSLIVDGTAAARDDGRILLEPEKAVLHRPAAHADGPLPPGGEDACGHDCRPVG